MESLFEIEKVVLFLRYLCPKTAMTNIQTLTCHAYNVNGRLKGGAGHIFHSYRQQLGFNVSSPLGVDNTLSKQVLPCFYWGWGGTHVVWIWMAPQPGHTGKRQSHACQPKYGYIVVLTVEVAWPRRDSSETGPRGLKLCSTV